jgi:two-component system, sensor histidine kinase PdtaS
MREILPLLTFLLICLVSSGQNIDSLKKAVTNSKNDSLKCDALNWLCYEILVDEPSKALQYGKEAKALAVKLKSQYLLGRAHERIAECYAELQNYKEAYNNYAEAISLTRKIKDTMFLGKTYNNLAICYMYEGKLDSSLLTHFQSLSIRRSSGDKKQIAQSLNNIGMIYRMKRDYKNAVKFYRESLSLKREYGDEKGVLNSSINIGNAWKALKEYDSSLHYYQYTLQLAEKRKSTNDIVDCKLNIGLLYNSKGLYDDGLKQFTAVLQYPSIKNNNNYSILLTGLGESWLGKKEYSKAVIYLEEALTYPSTVNKYEIPTQLNLDLSEAYKGLGNYKKALEHFEVFKSLSDSLLNENNMENINELSAKYETGQKEQKIALLNTQNAIKDISLESKQRQILLYIIGLSAAIIMAIGSFYLYRNKQRTSRQLQEKNKLISVSLAEKEVLLKEIHHRVKNNLQVVSSLLSLQSRSIKDEQALEAINEGRNRVKSMALIHQNLYREDNLTGVDIKEYIEKLSQSLFTSYNISANSIRLETDIDDLDLDVDTVIPLGLILNELISNSLKYAFAFKTEGILKVTLKEKHDHLLLAVKDNGAGLPKGWDVSKLSSLGYQLVRSFAQKMKAELIITGDKGTEVQMKITKYKFLSTHE